MERQQRRLAAILVADVAGYSRLMGVDEAGTLARFNALRAELLHPKFAQFKGRVVGSAGDSLLVEFGSAVDAVQCAVEAQERLAARNADLPEERRMAFRMGINLGDVIAEGDTIHGDGVNVAARLERLAEPGRVVLALSIHEQVKGKLPYDFSDLGEHTVKNIAEPVRAYRVEVMAAPPASSAARSPPDRPSIAVLPFTNMSGDPEQEYFADGITEDLITALARYRGIMVIARNSSFVFKGKVADVKDVGRKLDVGYLVEGSVRKAGKRVRVTAQLVEAATGAHLWADRFDRQLDDIFAVQDEVVEQVTWRVAGKVSETEIGSAKRRRTTSVDAYDLYLSALAHINRLTTEDSAKAVAQLERVIAMDSDFGRAYSALARAQIIRGNATRSNESYEAGLAAGLKALEMDDADESTHAEVGHLYNLMHRPDEAKPHLDRAVALNPNNAMTVFYKSYDLMYRGHTQDALAWLDRALRLDPMDPPWVHEALGSAYYMLRRYDDALQAYTRMGLRFGYHHAGLAAALAQSGRLEEARHHVAEARRLNPGYTLKHFASTKPIQPEDLQHWLEGLRKAGLPEQ